jgi:hypothetical protein
MAMCLWEYLDTIYGGEPIIRCRSFVYSATAGLVLFAVACLLCLLTPRWAAICALSGAVLSWPEAALALSAVPWSHLTWFVRYRPENAVAVLCLIVSSAYSVNQVRLLFRAPTGS